MLIREKNILNQYSIANLREKKRISINQLSYEELLVKEKIEEVEIK